ncbi:hypothetical protein AB0J80_16785 [Actinoplanes sp. NPDC049548]|uniref:hypothetical protein n=1 Tax=Actinoplanes sp. NPDC049548 TaxID=3155152 RepID=UPI00341F027B
MRHRTRAVGSCRRADRSRSRPALRRGRASGCAGAAGSCTRSWRNDTRNGLAGRLRAGSGTTRPRDARPRLTGRLLTEMLLAGSTTRLGGTRRLLTGSATRLGGTRTLLTGRLLGGGGTTRLAGARHPAGAPGRRTRRAASGLCDLPRGADDAGCAARHGSRTAGHRRGSDAFPARYHRRDHGRRCAGRLGRPGRTAVRGATSAPAGGHVSGVRAALPGGPDRSGAAADRAGGLVGVGATVAAALLDRRVARAHAGGGGCVAGAEGLSVRAGYGGDGPGGTAARACGAAAFVTAGRCAGSEPGPASFVRRAPATAAREGARALGRTGIGYGLTSGPVLSRMPGTVRRGVTAHPVRRSVTARLIRRGVTAHAVGSGVAARRGVAGVPVGHGMAAVPRGPGSARTRGCRTAVAWLPRPRAARPCGAARTGLFGVAVPGRLRLLMPGAAAGRRHRTSGGRHGTSRR